MTGVLTATAWALAVATAFPLGVLAMELMAGLAPSRRAAPAESGAATAVLIPAHDEAGGIAATLAWQRAQLETAR